MHRSADLAEVWFLAAVCWAAFGLSLRQVRAARGADGAVRPEREHAARLIISGSRLLTAVIAVVSVVVTVVALVASVA